MQVYWEGAARQRAISLWSMGSWGGSGFAALFGGLMAQNVGWRWIFFRLRGAVPARHADGAGTPESKAETQGRQVRSARRHHVHDHDGRAPGLRNAGRPTWVGAVPSSLTLLAVSVIFGILFVRIELTGRQQLRRLQPVQEHDLYRCDDVQLPANGTAGMLIVAMSLVQLGGEHDARKRPGMLTLGYAISIVAFIRVGEKLLQRSGLASR